MGTPIVLHIQPNPKSEVQISIENVISGPVKEGSFVAIQLPRLPPFSCGSTQVILSILQSMGRRWDQHTPLPPVAPRSA